MEECETGTQRNIWNLGTQEREPWNAQFFLYCIMYMYRNAKAKSRNADMLDAKAFQKRTHLCALAYIECDICLNWVSKHQNLYPQSFQKLQVKPSQNLESA